MSHLFEYVCVRVYRLSLHKLLMFYAISTLGSKAISVKCACEVVGKCHVWVFYS